MFSSVEISSLGGNQNLLMEILILNKALRSRSISSEKFAHRNISKWSKTKKKTAMMQILIVL